MNAEKLTEREVVAELATLGLGPNVTAQEIADEVGDLGGLLAEPITVAEAEAGLRRAEGRS